MRVRIVCSEKSVAFDGEMEKDPNEILEYVKGKAVEFNMPLQLEISGTGSFSITPTGQISRGRLFKTEKTAHRKNPR